MNALESVFRGLYCKADGSVPAHVPAAVCMHTSALSAWTLLLSTLSTSVLRQFLDKYVHVDLTAYSYITDACMLYSDGTIIGISIRLIEIE